ncbi:MAG: glycosyltransferase, partial [Gemmatimonadota bacterium]
AGLRIATEGDEPARLAFAADGVSAVAAWQYARRHRVPLALYLWDLPPWQVGTGRPNPILPVGGRLIKVPRPGAYRERSGYFSRIRFIAQRAIDIWAPSGQSRTDIQERFSVRVTEVPFCIDSDRFNRAAGWVPPAGPPTVLAISRLVAYKNHAAVLRAAALVTSKPRVHIVGSGPEAPALRHLAGQLGLELRLDEGWQSDQQILQGYLGAHVVVSASRFEGFGLTPLEATALGIPAVASDIPPHREFAAAGTPLVPLDDDRALAAAIEGAIGVGRLGGIDRVVSPVPVTMEACVARMIPKFAQLL